jgi:hypothetical protein
VHNPVTVTSANQIANLLIGVVRNDWGLGHYDSSATHQCKSSKKLRAARITASSLFSLTNGKSGTHFQPALFSECA